MLRRVETKTSRTAEITCLVRGLSNLEKRKSYHSDDIIAPVIMNSLVRFLIRTPVFNRLFLAKYPQGMYEYVIARTKFIDQEFKQALEQGVAQILVFGAGFDTRAVRFANLANSTRIFELDVPVTQKAKLQRYAQTGVISPENLVYVPIDFERQNLKEELERAGFQNGLTTLFVLEGLTMYLQPESVDGAFRVIAECAGPGSQLVFDHIYASVLRGENLYEGEGALTRGVTENGERFCFGIEKGQVNEFLRPYGFTAQKVMDAEALQNRFFQDTAGRVNGTHCIITAARQ